MIENIQKDIDYLNTQAQIELAKATTSYKMLKSDIERELKK